MGFREVLDKIADFFDDPGPEPVQGEPIEFQGTTYSPYHGQEDQYAVWPNAVCGRCRGVSLKPKLYYNRETETYYHKECLLKPEEGEKKK
jgi:hypothetical protein